MTNSIIAIQRSHLPLVFDNYSYVIDVNPQNDESHKDNLLYREAFVPSHRAMVFPTDIAVILANRWSANPNNATPRFVVLPEPIAF